MKYFVFRAAAPALKGVVFASRRGMKKNVSRRCIWSKDSVGNAGGTAGHSWQDQTVEIDCQEATIEMETIIEATVAHIGRLKVNNSESSICRAESVRL